MTHKILIIDDEPRWLAYWQAQGVDTVSPQEATTQSTGYQIAIVGSRFLSCIPVLRQNGVAVLVATWQPTTQEAKLAYRAGAVEYLTKSFDLTPAQIMQRGSHNVTR